MRRQALLLGTLAALGIVGTLPGGVSIPAPAPAISLALGGAGAGSALSSAFAGMSRRSMRYTGGAGGISRPTYRKHPFDRTVAQDKRDARKRRNQLRNKR